MFKTKVINNKNPLFFSRHRRPLIARPCWPVRGRTPWSRTTRTTRPRWLPQPPAAPAWTQQRGRQTRTWTWSWTWRRRTWPGGRRRSLRRSAHTSSKIRRGRRGQTVTSWRRRRRPELRHRCPETWPSSTRLTARRSDSHTHTHTHTHTQTYTHTHWQTCKLSLGFFHTLRQRKPSAHTWVRCGSCNEEGVVSRRKAHTHTHITERNLCVCEWVCETPEANSKHTHTHCNCNCSCVFTLPLYRLVSIHEKSFIVWENYDGFIPKVCVCVCVSNLTDFLFIVNGCSSRQRWQGAAFSVPPQKITSIVLRLLISDFFKLLATFDEVIKWTSAPQTPQCW